MKANFENLKTWGEDLAGRIEDYVGGGGDPDALDLNCEILRFGMTTAKMKPGLSSSQHQELKALLAALVK